jgi:hypothetical protein
VPSPILVVHCGRAQAGEHLARPLLVVVEEGVETEPLGELTSFKNRAPGSAPSDAAKASCLCRRFPVHLVENLRRHLEGAEAAGTPARSRRASAAP